MISYVGLLTEAAAFVDQARTKLDVRTKLCQVCGLTHYKSKEQWRLAQELRAISEKLHRLSTKGAG